MRSVAFSATSRGALHFVPGCFFFFFGAKCLATRWKMEDNSHPVVPAGVFTGAGVGGLELPVFRERVRERS